MKKEFAIGQVLTVTEFKTPYMINYLCQADLVRPLRRGYGKKRLFSFSDILILRVIFKILENGISVKKLKTALEASKGLGLLQSDGDKLFNGMDEIQFMVTNGKEVFFKMGDELVDLAKNGQLTFSFIMDIREIRNKLKTEIAKLPAA